MAFVLLKKVERSMPRDFLRSKKTVDSRRRLKKLVMRQLLPAKGLRWSPDLPGQLSMGSI